MSDRPLTLHSIDDKDWEIATLREAVIAPLAKKKLVSLDEKDAAAAALAVSRSTISTYLRRYRENPRTTSLLDQKRGPKSGGTKLPLSVEHIISHKIETFYLTPNKPTVQQLVREIAHECKTRDLSAPSRTAVEARVTSFEASTVVHRREGRKAALDRYKPIRSEFTADYPLEIVQVDHTKSDIIIVDDRDRQPIGRPIVTFLIDVCTRVVPGWYLTLEAPSATSVAMATTCAVLSKDLTLRNLGLNLPFPVSGLPEILHMDNAREFRSEALKRGCQQYGIKIQYRPVATPHFGGHIERLIGTFMGELHLLPGTTFSNIKEKGDYRPEEHACMTMSELNRWLVLQIGKYHNSYHTGISATPIQRWNDLVESRPNPICHPLDDRQFLLDFLPFEERVIGRHGIRLFRIDYWSDLLTRFIGEKRKFTIKYNPLDLSEVYVELPGEDYIRVNYKDVTRPPIAKWEHDRAIRLLRSRGLQGVDENLIFRCIVHQREILEEAKSKVAAREIQRLSNALALPRQPNVIEHKSLDDGESIDWREGDGQPFRIELRND